MAKAVRGDERTDKVAIGEAAKFSLTYTDPKVLRALDRATIDRMLWEIQSVADKLAEYRVVRVAQGSRKK